MKLANNSVKSSLMPGHSYSNFNPLSLNRTPPLYQNPPPQTKHMPQFFHPHNNQIVKTALSHQPKAIIIDSVVRKTTQPQFTYQKVSSLRGSIKKQTSGKMNPSELNSQNSLRLEQAKQVLSQRPQTQQRLVSAQQIPIALRQSKTSKKSQRNQKISVFQNITSSKQGNKLRSSINLNQIHQSFNEYNSLKQSIKSNNQDQVKKNHKIEKNTQQLSNCYACVVSKLNGQPGFSSQKIYDFPQSFQKNKSQIAKFTRLTNQLYAGCMRLKQR